ncbi:tRNA (N(6)-L-threonylcarbamoyladenosine(37)-C(2))-methylthiotransferase MtaB [Bacteroidia bacterium]|nr:tRNA (N(6)-L-threonylcarbamoyladenosine(37)-C(2))-methylthiotransferase MtaB [Bacteroidia bacterium]
MIRTVAFYTLGCKLNFAETSDMSRQFSAAGYQVVDFKETADVYVINTCAVTAIAEKKGRTIIHQIVRRNPDSIIAVIGCFSQLSPEEIAQIQGVDIILGNNDKYKILNYIDHCDKQRSVTSTSSPSDFVLSYSSDDRTRTFLKIQDGCDYFCSYCTIPFARGHNRSARIADIAHIVEQLAQQHVNEIVLTGINIGEFGKHHHETFLQLLQVLETTPIPRFRISSIEPNLITEEMITFIAASTKILPHFHIPLQSGCDRILNLMRRKYSRQLFADKINSIKQQIPHSFIAADVIAGFPSETEADFMDTVQFIERLPLAYLHVFPYSERKNTQALTIAEKVSPIEKKRRRELLQTLSTQKHQQFYQQQTDSVHHVLWEATQHRNTMYGFTDNYIRVKKTFDCQAVNTIETVTLSHLDADGIFSVDSHK